MTKHKSFITWKPEGQACHELRKAQPSSEVLQGGQHSGQGPGENVKNHFFFVTYEWTR
jgi:hypothetical protein